MNPEAQKLLDKAARSIDAAETLVQQGHLDFATARAYYAMFYIAEALLDEKGLHFRKHGGVHAAFGEHYAKPGVMDARYHRWLLDAFDQRIQGDYDVEGTISRDDVNKVIAHARDFLQSARQHLLPAK